MSSDESGRSDLQSPRVLRRRRLLDAGTIRQVSTTLTITARHEEALPVPVRNTELTVTRGYAVKHEGPTYRSDWLFFTHLEPAWAYGRAAQMSLLATRWTARQAALSVTKNPTDQQETMVLHLGALVPWNTEGTFDTRTLARWVEGISGPSSDWNPLR